MAALCRTRPMASQSHFSRVFFFSRPPCRNTGTKSESGGEDPGSTGSKTRPGGFASALERHSELGPRRVSVRAPPEVALCLAWAAPWGPRFGGQRFGGRPETLPAWWAGDPGSILASWPVEERLVSCLDLPSPSQLYFSLAHSLACWNLVVLSALQSAHPSLG